jgi:hypothetical protein
MIKFPRDREFLIINFLCNVEKKLPNSSPAATNTCRIAANLLKLTVRSRPQFARRKLRAQLPIADISPPPSFTLSFPPINRDCPVRRPPPALGSFRKLAACELSPHTVLKRAPVRARCASPLLKALYLIMTEGQSCLFVCMACLGVSL